MSVSSIQGNYLSGLITGGLNTNRNATNSISTRTTQIPADRVEINGKKKGLSTTQKCGIGLAVAGTLTAAALLIKGRAGAASKLAEHIDFAPAKTIEEAKTFAREKLGVAVTDEMSLDVLNYVNESLCFLRNKSPKNFSIKWVESKGVSGGYDPESFAQCAKMNDRQIFGINLSKNYIKNIDKILTEFINGEVERGALVNINGKLQYNELSRKMDVSSEISELANKFRQNPTSLTFKEKVKLHLGLGEIGETTDRLYLETNGDMTKLKDTVNVVINEFHPVIHEQGHILHHKKISQKDFDLFDKLEVLKQKGLSTSKYDEFTDKYLHTAQKVSDYAKASPAEFVAEVYAKSLSGVKFDKDVLDLYARYGGPAPA